MRLGIDTTHDHPVHVLVMDDDDNRMRRPWLVDLNEHLDRVEAFGEPTSLVVTGAGKYFSNGVDLGPLMSEPPDEINRYFRDLFGTCARILTFPMRTVAAINGHAFAGGAMFSLCFDYRVMREDRGWWCVPEADLGVSVHPAMAAILKARLPIATAHDAAVSARRYPGAEAQAAAVVDRTASEADLLPLALASAVVDAGKDRSAQRLIKEALYPELLTLLRDPPDLF